MDILIKMFQKYQRFFLYLHVAFFFSFNLCEKPVSVHSNKGKSFTFIYETKYS